MRATALVAAIVTVASSGCSFVLVKDPPRVKAGTDPNRVDCTDSAVVPGLDAIGGALAIAASAGGIIRQHTSDDGSPKHFDLYFAGPLLVAGIVYFIAAGGGTDRVEACRKIRERGADPNLWQVKPIDPGPSKPKPGEIEIGP